MKTILLFTLCFAFGWNCGSSKISEQEKESFINTVKSNMAVMDATITDVGYLYIAVLNDGTDKTPMAVYHCRLAQEKGIAISSVKIVDVQSFQKGDGWAKGNELGISHCD